MFDKICTNIAGYQGTSREVRPEPEVVPIIVWPVDRTYRRHYAPGRCFARSENGINTFGLTFAKQLDAIRTERLISETESGR